MALTEYKKKRNFDVTPEPAGRANVRRGRQFVVQEHHARRLHYDFRLELDGVLLSWAVPKGPSNEPAERRLAVQTEDHPIEYGKFEGTIPEGEYGAGLVKIWDRGTWEPLEDPRAGLRKGKLKFSLRGKKLKGIWTLVRFHGDREDRDEKKNWLLIRDKDDVGIAAPASNKKKRTEEVSAAKATRASAARPVRSKPASTSARTRGQVMPEAVAPELATLVDAAPRSDDWLHETKFDGYRLLARLERGRARLFTRSGKDWTSHFPEIAQAVEALPATSAWIDGEMVALDKKGLSSFQRLQRALKEGSAQLSYFVFDLLYLDGESLVALPLEERKARLDALLPKREKIVLRSEHVIGRGAEQFRKACKLGWEGIISKRRDAPYRAGRGRDWLKVKCERRQEFVIGGFTDPEGSNTEFGALLLGTNDDEGRLRYAGKVGTGFDARLRVDLGVKLTRLVRATPPFVNSLNGAAVRGVHWVEPKLVAEVAFTEWTDSGVLRHPSFQGLREDKAASEVRREEPRMRGSRRQETEPEPKADRAPRGKASRPAVASRTKAARESEDEVVIAGVTLTHPDRVLYPEIGLTKRALAEYYVRVGERMLPYVIDRPLAVLRCPDGREGGCFFQKHLESGAPKGIRVVPVPEREGKSERGFAIRDVSGLVSLAQLGILEVHLWGARIDRIEQPDVFVIDLDPDVGLDWNEVVRAARSVRKNLQALGLESFVKTTGGKGLHVVVPIERQRKWDEVKQFTKAFVDLMAEAEPDAYTTTAVKARRHGRIFLDYLRNGRGATAVAPFSTRARPGATVAMPVSWQELGRIKPDRFTVESAAKDARRPDPWAEYDATRNSLSKAVMAAVGLG